MLCTKQIRMKFSQWNSYTQTDGSVAKIEETPLTYLTDIGNCTRNIGGKDADTMTPKGKHKKSVGNIFSILCSTCVQNIQSHIAIHIDYPIIKRNTSLCSSYIWDYMA